LTGESTTITTTRHPPVIRRFNQPVIRRLDRRIQRPSPLSVIPNIASVIAAATFVIAAAEPQSMDPGSAPGMT
jgi:hypothetical protein